MQRLQQLYLEATRRRVFRALLAWGIFAFAVLQVVEPVLHALDAKDRVLKVVVGLLVAGFPVTAALSWVFDLTSSGVVRTLPAGTVLDGTVERRAEAGPVPPPRRPEPGGSSPAGATDGGPEHLPGPLSRLIRDLARASGDALLAAWDRELRPGERVGRFRVVREIGRGGFGAVYEAEDSDLGRHVALKALRPRRTGEELSADWIEKEAEAIARLDHPCIVTLFDVGSADGGPYLVMELLRGETLAQRLARGPLPPGDAIRVARQVARGLAHAHARGTLHRDLKPANVFLCDDGRVKLLDFGLAHLLGEGGLRGSGTPGYMAPEQARGEAIDARADVYAAAMTLRESMAGSREPGGEASIPAPVRRAIERALSRDRERRPRDGTAWLEALEASRIALERPRRLLRLAGLAVAGAAVGLALASVATGRWPWKGPRGSPGAPLTIGVADLANDTRDPELDGLSGLLVTSLEQSRRLRIVSRGRIQEHARSLGRGDADRMDESTAREIGRRGRLRALLLTSIRKIGDTYVVDLRAIDPQRDEYLFTLREQAEGKKALLALVDRLSERARLALDESPDEVAASGVQVARAVTGSLEAYRHYLLAQQAFEDHEFERSVKESKAALALDPDLALAHVWLALLAEFNVAGGEREDEHVEAALARASDLPPKERRFTEALAMAVARRPESVEAFRRLAEDYPLDKYVMLFAGRRNPDRREGRAFLEKALDLDPAFVWPLYILMTPTDPQLDRARKAFATRPTFATRFNLALSLGFAGRLDESLDEARRVQVESGGSRVEVDSLVAANLVARGRLSEAEAIMARWLDPGVNDASRHMALVQLIQIHALQGRRKASLEALGLDQAIRVEPRVQGWTALFAGMGNDRIAARNAYLAWSDVPRSLAPFVAEAGLADLATRLTASLPAGDPYREAVAAIDAWRSGRPAGAAPALLRLRDERFGTYGSWSYVLGLLYRDTGRCEEALREFDRLLAQFPWPWQVDPPFGVWMPLALLEGARCGEALGRPADAAERLDRLLEMWKGADPDLPALADARTMRARLAAPAPAR